MLARPPADGPLADGAGDETLPDEPLAVLAARHGLRSTAARPSLPAYLRLLWQRRYFIGAYATARNISTYTEARLGQIWQILTPLLNAGVYYLIFGVIFGARRGVPNYPAFLVTGVFVFSFTERSILAGSRVMANNVSLIRAMYFPRACLPLAYGVVELQQMLLSMIVLFGIVLATGEPVTWYWLLLILVIALQTMFNLGAALILARMGAQVRDVSQLVPFLLRTWRYFCGVMYSIAALPGGHPVVGQDRARREPGRGVHHADPAGPARLAAEIRARSQAVQQAPSAPRTSRPTATRRCPCRMSGCPRSPGRSARWPSAWSTSGGRKRGTGAGDQPPG